MKAHLTIPCLNAMSAALASMLAGEEGEGDWPDDVTIEDMTLALVWVVQQIEQLSAPSQHHPHP